MPNESEEAAATQREWSSVDERKLFVDHAREQAQTRAMMRYLEELDTVTGLLKDEEMLKELPSKLAWAVIRMNVAREEMERLGGKAK